MISTQSWTLIFYLRVSPELPHCLQLCGNSNTSNGRHDEAGKMVGSVASFLGRLSLVERVIALKKWIGGKDFQKHGYGWSWLTSCSVVADREQPEESLAVTCLRRWNCDRILPVPVLQLEIARRDPSWPIDSDCLECCLPGYWSERSRRHRLRCRFLWPERQMEHHYPSDDGRQAGFAGAPPLSGRLSSWPERCTCEASNVYTRV